MKEFEKLDFDTVDVTGIEARAEILNAKRALCGLLAFAQMRPDGVWRVC